jgi:DNA-3-methyladenine glycosylase
MATSFSSLPDAVPLPRAFYERETVAVARELLGKLLVRRLPRGRLLAGRVVETEAYHGFDDLASHAHGGPTPRSQIMYGPAGYAYVYQIYGVWFCLNAVTGPAEFPSAVLLRAVHVPGPDPRAGAGPGKLTRALRIDKRHNGQDLVGGGVLWLADDGHRVPADKITSGARIGVEYAGAWAKLPWRFWVDGDPAVSRLPPARRPGRGRARP